MRENLILWEKQSGYKGKWVAEKLKISYASWSKIKYGLVNPSTEVMYKFKEQFPDADVWELFKNIK